MESKQNKNSETQDTENGFMIVKVGWGIERNGWMGAKGGKTSHCWSQQIIIIICVPGSHWHDFEPES